MIQYSDFLHKLRNAEDKGKYILASCPFHQDGSPSLLVFKDGWFHCLGANCARSGRWITLWNKVQGQPVQIASEKRLHYKAPDGLFEYESREEMAYQAHIHLVKFNRGWYFEMRGLGDAIDIHEIGYHRGWYTIPVWDREGKFQNVIFRASPPIQDATGYRYWADGKPTLYVPDWHLLDRCDYIVIVFGMLDALTLNKFRLPVVTPTHGYTLDPNWLAAYRKPIYIIPDKNEEKSALKLIGEMGWRGKMVRLDYPEGLKDANDFLKSGREKELLTQLEKIIR